MKLWVWYKIKQRYREAEYNKEEYDRYNDDHFKKLFGFVAALTRRNVADTYFAKYLCFY